jgi:hypothetical protein
VIGGRSRRPENRDRGTDPRQRVKTKGEFGGDLTDPLGVGGANARRLIAQPQQQLLVERWGVVQRFPLCSVRSFRPEHQ